MQGILILIRPGLSLYPSLLAPLLFISTKEAEKQNALLGQGLVSSEFRGVRGEQG